MTARRPIEPPPVWADDVKPPATRAGCVGGPRPCLAVACRYHLVHSLGRREQDATLADEDGFETMRETCALDVADRRGHTLEEVGELLGVVRERVRQLEESALAEMQIRGLRLRICDTKDLAAAVGGRRR